MQESARAALSYTKANLSNFDLDDKVFENTDIHLHVPAGAIPKDGPSAGIAMATALTSVLANKPINTHVAMTGEITIRGRVLPIGGLKEKAMGALRAGIHTIIIPEKNKRDLSEIIFAFFMFITLFDALLHGISTSQSRYVLTTEASAESGCICSIFFSCFSASFKTCFGILAFLIFFLYSRISIIFSSLSPNSRWISLTCSLKK